METKISRFKIHDPILRSFLECIHWATDTLERGHITSTAPRPRVLHLIGLSKHQEMTLRILRQVIIVQSMPPDMDTFGIPQISSSSAAILDHESSDVIRIVYFLLEVRNRDEDIKIRPPSFCEHLLD